MSEIRTYPLVNEKLTLSGQYWIGDPCYVFSEIDWMRFCHEMFGTDEKKRDNFDDRNTVRVIDVDGELIYAFGTAYGDGVYPLIVEDTIVANLGVDAGMLAIVPIKLLEKDGWKKISKKFGKVISFNGETRDINVKNGDFSFGDIKIFTNNEINYDDYEEDDYYNYDEYGDYIDEDDLDN